MTMLLDSRSSGTRHDDTNRYIGLIGGLTLPAFFINAVDEFIHRGVLVGWWSDFYFFYLYASSVVAALSINLKGAHLSAGVVNGSPSFTPFLGLKGNGSSIWVDHGFGPADVPGATASNYFVGQYIAQDGSSTIDEITAVGGGSTIGLRARNLHTAVSFGNNATGDNISPVLTAVGSLIQFRSDPSFYTLFKGQSGPLMIPRAAAGALPTNHWGVLRTGAAGATYSNALISAFFGGAGAGILGSASKQADFAAALDNLMLELGVVTDDQLNPSPENLAAPYAFGPASISSVTPSGIRVFQQTPPPPGINTENVGSVVGSFTVGETITQATTGATGVVVSFASGVLTYANKTSTLFVSGGSQIVTGGSSGATCLFTSDTSFALYPLTDAASTQWDQLAKVTAILNTISGTYVVGETITQASSGATGIVTSYTAGVVQFYALTSTAFVFGGSQTVTGSVSSATSHFEFNASWAGNGYPWVWFNRCNDKTTNNANPVFSPIYTSGGNQCRCEFDTQTLADGATLAFLAAARGKAAHTGPLDGYLDIANAYGFADGDWIDYATASSVKSSLNTVSGTFLPGESISQSSTGATGTVSSYAGGFLYFNQTNQIAFTFGGAEFVTGGSSGATCKLTASVSSPDTVFTGTPTNGRPHKITLNKIIGPMLTFPTLPANMRKGILFDYEVADLRSGAAATSGLLAANAATKAAGYETTCYLNPLNGGNAANEGLDQSNLYLLHAAFDFMSVTVYPDSIKHDATASMANQLALLTGPAYDQPIRYSKLMLTIGLGGYNAELSSANATKLRSYITGNGVSANAFGAINNWRDGGQPGGAISRQYNQVIAITEGLPTA